MRARDAEELLPALDELRRRLGGCRLELEVAGAAEARRARGDLLGQIDDYLLPRLRDLDAPLLVVIGGSTGAGKSTLLNSLVGEEVSAPGVLRPTTRAPVLACPPPEARWWLDERVLPGLARATGATTDARTLRVVPHPGAPEGMALLDAPDIDSVVADNRELAAQLLSAADLWLFVTTAARYADAVPWGFLRTARARSTALAVILNRVPSEALGEVPGHLSELMARAGLADAPLFTVPEASLQAARIPEAALAPLRAWLARLAGDARERARVVAATLDGALESLDERVSLVAAHVDAQTGAAEGLVEAALAAYDTARAEIDDASSGGSLLRGEVLARWHEVVGTGELMRSLETRIGQWRDRLRRALLGEPPPEAEVAATLGGSVAAVVMAAADRAAERAAGSWEESPAGSALLHPQEALGRSSPELAARIDAEVRGWQSHVLELVRSEGASKRAMGRVLSLGVNAVGAALMISVFAHTGGLTGAELVVAGGTATVSQKLLEALFGDQSVRALTMAARTDLLERVQALLDVEAGRFTARARAAAPSPGEASALQAAVDAVRAGRL